MKHLRHLIEYGLFRVVLFLLDFLPYTFTCMVARGAANVWWVFDRKRQIVGRDNVIRSGIETDPKKARAIAKKAAHHMAIVVVESLRSTDFLSDEDTTDHLVLDIKPDVLAVMQDPEQSLIIASGHFGNWEVAGHWVSKFKPVAGITRAMNNPLIESMVK